MNDDISHYYEKELAFIREMGAEFAVKYPKVAGKLSPESGKCADPHTERLVEAIAFLGGRIKKKIDDGLPDITESFINNFYPHYTTPIPSMSIATFEPSMPALTPEGFMIDQDTLLYSKPVNGIPCRFATGYPVKIWPIEVVSAHLSDIGKPVGNARQAIVVRLKTCNNLGFSQLGLSSLRFFLNGAGQHMFHLYELLFNNVCHVDCISYDSDGKRKTIALTPGNILPVGFGDNEALIPFGKRTFPGYILLLEYFCFPEKFLFFDLSGLDPLRNSNCQDSLEIWFYLDRAPKANLLIDRETFRLNAAPIINLFKRIAEPIRITHEKTEYRIIPDISRPDTTEVFSVDGVVSINTVSGKKRVYEPIYSTRGIFDDSKSNEEKAYWKIERRSSGREGDKGADIFLSFADLNFEHSEQGEEVVAVNVTITNRDLPARLNFGDRAGDFVTDAALPVSSINCLIKPTPARRPPLGGALLRRLISHMSFNYLSLVEGGAETLREMLSLYDLNNSPATRQQINGIVSLDSCYVMKRIGRSFCRGVQLTITLDEDRFVGAGHFLFASVLEFFIGMYISVNSFSQLIAKTSQSKERLKVWPPRCGNKTIR